MHNLINAFTKLSVLLSTLLLNAIMLTATAQEFVWAPEISIGSKLPDLSARDQNGTLQSFDELAGDKGLIVVMSRSFDWCPYCIRQLQQLVEAEAEFNALGFNVTTMTYDPVATLKEAEEEYEVTFPILYDENSAFIKTLGILNTQYELGHRAYGIPYPGIFVVDAQGVIRAKLAEEDYRERPDFSLVLEQARKL